MVQYQRRSLKSMHNMVHKITTNLSLCRTSERSILCKPEQQLSDRQTRWSSILTSMRYVTNITVYTNDGQKISETFPSGSYSSQSGNATGVFQGVIPINFSLPQPGTPSVVNILATGQNNKSFVIGFCFFGFCFSFPVVTAVSQPITWQYSITVPNPGPEPTASVTVPQGVQGGTIKISWQGSWVLNTATAK